MRWLKNGWGWVKDYAYVAYWMTRGFVRPQDPRQYAASNIEHMTSIILVPGVYENWQFMKPVADHMHSAGYGVHVLSGLGYNTGTIPEMARIVAEYISANNLRRVIIIAHSKGGLIAKYALMNYTERGRIDHVIAINTPFSGSKYAYLFLLPSIRTFTPRHTIIQMLAENHIANQHITSIYSQFDPHIPETSYLEGAKNIIVPVVGHFRPIGNSDVLAIIMKTVTARGESV